MKTHLQLLPVAESRKYVVRRYLRQWSFVWLLFTCFALLACLTQRWTYQNTKRELTKKKQLASPIVKQIAAIKKMETRLTGLKQHEVIQLGLENERQVIPLLGVVSKSARQCGNNLYVDRFSLDRDLIPHEESEAPMYGGLTLEGTATDNLVVARFVSLLRDARLFQRVELKSSASATINNNQLLKYVVDCHF